MDILFGIDSSSSIGENNFKIELKWIKEFIRKEIDITKSAIGFNIYSTETNRSKEPQFWSIDNLTKYIDNIQYVAGWTNTFKLINDTIDTFDKLLPSIINNNINVQEILFLITDGNPCMRLSKDGCPMSVCKCANIIKNKAIRVIIIKIGDNIDSTYISCLSYGLKDIYTINAFNINHFNGINDKLSDNCCDPTISPTISPTNIPTILPTKIPTINPTFLPTNNPTTNPAKIPTKIPTLIKIDTININSQTTINQQQIINEEIISTTNYPTNEDIISNYSDYILFIDNSCGLSNNDCDELLYGATQIISRLLKNSSNDNNNIIKLELQH